MLVLNSTVFLSKISNDSHGNDALPAQIGSISCTGRELVLLQCSYKTGISCPIGDAVSVVCSKEIIKIRNVTTYTKFCLSIDCSTHFCLGSLLACSVFLLSMFLLQKFASLLSTKVCEKEHQNKNTK